MIRRPTSDDRPEDGAPECRTHGEPVHCRAQAPESLNSLLRTRDDDRVEAKEKPRKRGDERPEEETWIHDKERLRKVWPQINDNDSREGRKKRGG